MAEVEAVELPRVAVTRGGAMTTEVEAVSSRA